MEYNELIKCIGDDFYVKHHCFCSISTLVGPLLIFFAFGVAVLATLSALTHDGAAKRLIFLPVSIFALCVLFLFFKLTAVFAVSSQRIIQNLFIYIFIQAVHFGHYIQASHLVSTFRLYIQAVQLNMQVRYLKYTCQMKLVCVFSNTRFNSQTAKRFNKKLENVNRLLFRHNILLCCKDYGCCGCACNRLSVSALTNLSGCFLYRN